MRMLTLVRAAVGTVAATALILSTPTVVLAAPDDDQPPVTLDAPLADPRDAQGGGVHSAPDTSVAFGAFESATFPEVYEALLVSNDPETVSSFLAAQADEGVPQADMLGIDETLTTQSSQHLLDLAAHSAEKGAPLPDEVVQETTPGGGQEFEAMSVSTAPVQGSAVNDRRSWRFSSRYNWTECPTVFSCKVTSWLNFRVTTDPGRLGSKSSLNFTEGGKGAIKGVRLSSDVLSAGRNIMSVTNNWNTPGYGTQWNSPHRSTTGKTFQMYYQLRVTNPNNTYGTGEWKTGKTATCKNPSKGAFRCLFPR